MLNFDVTWTLFTYRLGKNILEGLDGTRILNFCAMDIAKITTLIKIPVQVIKKCKSNFKFACTQNVTSKRPKN